MHASVLRVSICTAMFFEPILTSRNNSADDRMSVWDFRLKSSCWCPGCGCKFNSRVGPGVGPGAFVACVYVLRPSASAKPDHHLLDCQHKTKRERAPTLLLSVLPVLVLLLSFSLHLLFSTLGQSQPTQPPPRSSRTPLLSFTVVLCSFFPY